MFALERNRREAVVATPSMTTPIESTFSSTDPSASWATATALTTTQASPGRGSSNRETGNGMARGMSRSQTFFCIQGQLPETDSTSPGTASLSSLESSSNNSNTSNNSSRLEEEEEEEDCPPYKRCSNTSGSSSGSDWWCDQEALSRLDFVSAVQQYLQLQNENTSSKRSDTPYFSKPQLRQIMEPHLRKARQLREKARVSKTSASNSNSNDRKRITTAQSWSTSHAVSTSATNQPRHHSHNRSMPHVADSIASSMGVPYTALRKERRFLYDEHTYPLHTLLADALGVSDLSLLHTLPEATCLLPLRDPTIRTPFHKAYDHCLAHHCIPLLHSMAVFDRTSTAVAASDRVTYRYQAFPTIHVARPGKAALEDGPVCDSILGHGLGCLTLHIPLTPPTAASGNSSSSSSSRSSNDSSSDDDNDSTDGCWGLFTESHPGKEDWHRLTAPSKSVGLAYLFDGTRCLHFDLANPTDRTHVSLTIRIQLYRESECRQEQRQHDKESSPHDGTISSSSSGSECSSKCSSRSRVDHDPDSSRSTLCSAEVLRQDSFAGPGSTYYDEAIVDLSQTDAVVVKKRGSAASLLEPDPRLGYPFA